MAVDCRTVGASTTGGVGGDGVLQPRRSTPPARWSVQDRTMPVHQRCRSSPCGGGSPVVPLVVDDALEVRGSSFHSSRSRSACSHCCCARRVVAGIGRGFLSGDTELRHDDVAHPCDRCERSCPEAYGPDLVRRKRGPMAAWSTSRYQVGGPVPRALHGGRSVGAHDVELRPATTVSGPPLSLTAVHACVMMTCFATLRASV